MTPVRGLPEHPSAPPGKQFEAGNENAADGQVVPLGASLQVEPMIAPLGGYARPWISLWVLLVFSLSVAGCTGYVLIRLHDFAAHRSSVNTLVTKLRAGAYHQSALEWQAVAEGRLSPPVSLGQHEIQGTMDDLVSTLWVADPKSSVSKTLSDAYRSYDSAISREFLLLGYGQRSQAEEVDEQQVDPAFERLNETLEAASRHYSGDARRATQYANQGTLLALLIGVTVIGLLAWRYQRTRSKAVTLLAHQARHDPLTALPNRALLLERLRGELSRATRRREPVFLLWLDLDDFKIVNDTLGHYAGDQVLRIAGERLVATLRPGDTPARMGGDEFTLLLADVSELQGATSVAKRLEDELSVPFRVAGHEVYVHGSIGIASSVPGETSAEELLRNADVAMYEAKKQGKSQHQVFSPGMNEASWRQLEVEGELRIALEQQQFEVFYQPILDLDSGETSELEALVRWDHPRRGLIPPSEFISAAERSGQIDPLGLWVLTEACMNAVAWQASSERHRSVRVSVNISARQLRDPEFSSRVTKILAEAGLDPHLLTLEITESSMLDEHRSAVASLQALRGMGVRIAVDDFGTGFAALGTLKLYPIDSLKIDRSFVAGLGDDAQNTAIVHAVIAFAKTLELQVTAEGIETTGQLEQLRALGCDHGQGYYFARPLPQVSVQPYLQGNADSLRHRERAFDAPQHGPAKRK
jgi:diguanylate cyclase (GGDEF)-like protein